MKKILSLISALALCASVAVTSVSAELSYDADADVVTMPTLEELKARTPEITLSAKKAESTADITAAGIPAKQAGNYYKDGYDAYVVTMTATNIGDLAVGYTDTNYETQTGVCLPAIALSLTNDAKIQKYGTKTSEAVAPFVDKSSVGVQGTLNFIFGSATNVGYSYPAFDSEANGSSATNPTITTQFVICLNTDDSLDLVVENAEVTYVHLVGGVANVAIVPVEVDTIKLGTSAPVLAEPTVNVETKTNGTTQGFLATCTVDATIKPISGLKLALTDGTNNATKEYTFTKIEAGTAKYAVNVQNVPDGTTVTATGSAIVAE